MDGESVQVEVGKDGQEGTREYVSKEDYFKTCKLGRTVNKEYPRSYCSSKGVDDIKQMN